MALENSSAPAGLAAPRHWSLTALLARHPLSWGRGTLTPEASDRPTLLLLSDGRCRRTRRMLAQALAPLAGTALADGFHFRFFDRDYGPTPERLARWHAIVHQQPTPSPLLVFLSPGGRPFLTASALSGAEGGFGPEAERVLTAILEQLETDADAVERQGQAVLDAEADGLAALPGVGGWGPLEKAFLRALEHATDERDHGLGAGPKQPFPALLQAQLALPSRRDEAMMTLTALCRRGLQDHVGGGFFNHSEDRSWREPYPELRFDHTALLMLALVEALRFGADPLFEQALRQAAQGLCDRLEAHGGRLPLAEHTVLRDDPQAPFLWHRAALQRSLSTEAYAVLETLYGLDKAANAGRLWRLERRDAWRSVVHRLGLEAADAERLLEEGLGALKRERDALDFTAVYPTLTNALAARALLSAGSFLKAPSFLTHGLALTEELLADWDGAPALAWQPFETGWHPDPAAPPSSHEGTIGAQGALLMAIFEALQEGWHPVLAARGEALAEALAEQFEPHALEAGDGARSSPLILATEALLLASALYQQPTWREQAERFLAAVSAPAQARPLQFASALTLARHRPEVVVLRGAESEARAQVLRAQGGLRYWAFAPPMPWLCKLLGDALAAQPWDKLLLSGTGPLRPEQEDPRPSPQIGAKVLSFPFRKPEA